MKVHEFYSAYANTPLPQRDIQLGKGKRKSTLNTIWKRVMEIENCKRLMEREQEVLIERAKRGLPGGVEAHNNGCKIFGCVSAQCGMRL